MEMEKRKIKLLRSMQSLLTDFTVKSNDDDSGTNSNNTNNIHTKLSKLQQILKMKASDDLRNSLTEELISIQNISEIKSDKKQDDEEEEIDYLNSTAVSPEEKQENGGEKKPGEAEENLNSTTESSNEDCQWRFVETCMNSLLLLDQYMMKRPNSGETNLIPERNTATPQTAHRVSGTSSRSINSGAESQRVASNELPNTAGSPQPHNTNTATEIVNKLPSSRTIKGLGKTAPHGKKSQLQHQPNFLGAKDLKIVSGVVQLMLTYGVWPRLLQGRCYKNNLLNILKNSKILTYNL